MSWDEDVWKWVKTAPLPVVLVVSLFAGGASMQFAYAQAKSSQKKAEEARDKAAEAQKVADQSASDTQRTKEQVDEMRDDIKELLKAVARIEGALDTKKKKE